MKRYWMFLGLGLMSALIALAAYACGDDNGDSGAADDVPDEVFQLVAELLPEGDSTAAGQAEISVNGDGILVSIGMEGLSSGAHPNHLHHGSCADQGEIHITLDNIVADDAGDGSQTTSNSEEPLSHYETGHYLAVHEAEDDLTVVACGDVVTT